VSHQHTANDGSEQVKAWFEEFRNERLRIPLSWILNVKHFSPFDTRQMGQVQCGELQLDDQQSRAAKLSTTGDSAIRANAKLSGERWDIAQNDPGLTDRT